MSWTWARRSLMSRKFITPLALTMLPDISEVPNATLSKLVTTAACDSSCLLNSDTCSWAPSDMLAYVSLLIYDLMGARSL